MPLEKGLPLPGSEEPFGVLVDRYVAENGVCRQEAFRRIAAVTGNSTKGLALRYRQKYDQPWRFSAAKGFPEWWVPASLRKESA